MTVTIIRTTDIPITTSVTEYHGMDVVDMVIFLVVL